LTNITAVTIELHNRHKVIIWNAAARVSALIVFYISLRVVLPQYGASLYGAWVTLAACLGVLSFLDFGFGNTLVAKLGSKIIIGPTKKDAYLIKNTLLAIFILSIMSVVFITVGIKAVDFRIVFGSLSSLDYQLFENLSLVFLLCLFLQINSNGIIKIFLAIDRPHIAYFTNTVGGTISIFILIMFPYLNVYYLFFVAFALPSVFTSVLLVLLNNEGFLQGPLSYPRFFIFIRQTLRSSSAFTIIQLSAVAIIAGDYLVISSYLSTSQAGEYAFVQKNAQLFSMVVTILNVPMWVTYSRLTSTSNVDSRVFRLVKRAIFTASVISAFGACFLLFATNLMAGFFSGGHLTVHFPLVIAMSAWMIVENAGIAITAFKNGALMLKQQIIEILGMSVFGFLIKILLITHLGVTAIPLGSAFVYLAMTGLVYFVLYRNETLAKLGINKAS
jgi:hypothetical protein